MKFTNKAQLPKGIYDAIISDSYNKGEANYSASQLMMPPQMRRLIALKWDEIEIDISEEIWKLLGTAIHYILEQQQLKPVLQDRVKKLDEKLRYFYQKLEDDNEGDARYHSTKQTLKEMQDFIIELDTNPLDNSYLKLEDRMYGTLAGIRISGKPDWFDHFGLNIEDYKVTSVWKFLKKDYEDYKKQANIYRWLAKEHHNLDVKKLQINMIFRDWKLGEMKRNEEYPRVPAQAVEMEVMSYIEITEYLLERLKFHEQANEYTTPEQLAENLPCTEEERWHKPDTWKVVKNSSRAIPGGVFSEENYGKEAESKAKSFHVEKGEEEKGYYVIFEPGEDTRCQLCLVRNFCSQYQQRQVKIEEDTNVEIPKTSPFDEDIVMFPSDEEQEESKEEKPAEKKNPDESFTEKFEQLKKQNQEHVEKKKQNSSEKSNNDSSVDDILNNLDL